MALQGTIKDFGLSDIFQLIGMQRKTGVLTLENGEDTVTVHFHEGSVVGADTRLRNLEDLLGGVLVRTGRITEEQLQDALRVQKNTLQRLGYVLVRNGYVSEDDLREALRVQVTQIVYRLFRWRDGSYHFTPADTMEYDREHFVPVSAETILMEGARMVDEWPIIERRIRSDATVFHKTPAAAALEAPVRSLVDADIDFKLDGEAGDAPTAGGDLRVSLEEREVLRAVDGQATVREIVERSPLGEFDVYRILYELLNRHLIEEADAPRGEGAARARGRFVRTADLLLRAGLLAAALFAVLTFSHNPMNPWKMALEESHGDRLRLSISRGRLDRLQQALRVFYLDLGSLPGDLGLLAAHGYVDAQDLLDPWGRPYGYESVPGGYRLVALDPQGRPDPDLSVAHRHSSSQRLVLEGPARVAPPVLDSPDLGS